MENSIHVGTAGGTITEGPAVDRFTLHGDSVQKFYDVLRTINNPRLLLVGSSYWGYSNRDLSYNIEDAALYIGFSSDLPRVRDQLKGVNFAEVKIGAQTKEKREKALSRLEEITGFSFADQIKRLIYAEEETSPEETKSE